MRDHIAAMRATLTAAGLASHYVTVEGAPSYPYVLLSPGISSPHPDAPLCDSFATLAFDILVTAVAGTPDGADIVAARAKAALCPGDRPTALVVAGRRASIRWERTETAGVDRDVTIPNTKRNPAFRKDSYRIESTPA